VTITVAYQKPAKAGDDVIPAYGFVVESPGFIAFCATRYRGIDYATPTLFTARSLDGRPIAESSKVRVYHGFGGRRIRLGERVFEVPREAIVRVALAYPKMGTGSEQVKFFPTMNIGCEVPVPILG